MTREEPKLLTDIWGFTTLFYVISRHKSFECLESSESDNMQYAGLTLPFAN